VPTPLRQLATWPKALMTARLFGFLLAFFWLELSFVGSPVIGRDRGLGHLLGVFLGWEEPCALTNYADGGRGILHGGLKRGDGVIVFSRRS